MYIIITILLSLFLSLTASSQNRPVPTPSTSKPQPLNNSSFDESSHQAGTPELGDNKWKILASIDMKTRKTNKELKTLLDSKDFKIAGFMIPLDYEAKKLTEFLLVPYIPSCMHVPPPPENQIIHIKLDKKDALEPSFYPIEVTGALILNQPNKQKKKDDFMPDPFYSLNALTAKEIK